MNLKNRIPRSARGNTAYVAPKRVRRGMKETETMQNASTRQRSITQRASSKLKNGSRLSSSSRSFPLNDSTYPFSQGLPLAINSVPTSARSSQRTTAVWYFESCFPRAGIRQVISLAALGSLNFDSIGVVFLASSAARFRPEEFQNRCSESIILQSG